MKRSGDGFFPGRRENDIGPGEERGRSGGGVRGRVGSQGNVRPDSPKLIVVAQFVLVLRFHALVSVCWVWAAGLLFSLTRWAALLTRSMASHRLQQSSFFTLARILIGWWLIDEIDPMTS